MGGVVLGEVRIGARIAQVVDRHNLEFALATGFVDGAQDVAADAAVAVDGDLDGHAELLEGQGVAADGKRRF